MGGIQVFGACAVARVRERRSLHRQHPRGRAHPRAVHTGGPDPSDVEIAIFNGNFKAEVLQCFWK